MKILIVRFSSIGDIVLTTPVIRAIKQQMPEAEIHYLTKKSFVDLVKYNPHISKIYYIEKSIDEVILPLVMEQYTFLVDLHKNLRTLQLKRKLKVPSKSFHKLNFKKWLYTQFKWNKLPNVHIVERYFKTVKKIGIQNDQLPCELFFTAEETIHQVDGFDLNQSFLAFAVGSQFETKQIPLHKALSILEPIQTPIVLLGGENDRAFGELVKAHFPEKTVMNTCGRYRILESASIVSKASVMLTGDTGMMHIASCYQIPIVSVWGNTTPAIGMYPYFPNESGTYQIFEVPDLPCRPCSKIGYHACPKKHFNCMELQDSVAISKGLQKMMDKA